MEVISAEVAERGCDVLKPKRGELACSRLQPRESLPKLPRRRPSAPLWAMSADFSRASGGAAEALHSPRCCTRFINGAEPLRASAALRAGRYIPPPLRRAIYGHWKVAPSFMCSLQRSRHPPPSQLPPPPPPSQFANNHYPPHINPPINRTRRRLHAMPMAWKRLSSCRRRRHPHPRRPPPLLQNGRKRLLHCRAATPTRGTRNFCTSQSGPPPT